MPGEGQPQKPSTRFATLRSAVGRVFGRGTAPPDYRSVQIPDRNAPTEAWPDYRAEANRLGASITPEDIATFRDLNDDLTGEALMLTDKEVVAKQTNGVRQMIGAYAMQHPEAIERARERDIFAAYNQEDFQADIFPSRLAHLAPEIVTANAEQFTQRQKVVNALPPMSANPTAKEFTAAREAFKGVGLRLNNYDRYVNQLIVEGKQGLLSVQKVSLAVEALQELKLPQSERKLLNMKPEQFAEVLRTRQPLPKERAHTNIDIGLDESVTRGRADDGDYEIAPNFGARGLGREDSGTYLYSPVTGPEEPAEGAYSRSPDSLEPPEGHYWRTPVGVEPPENPYSRTPVSVDPPPPISPVRGTELVGDQLLAKDGGKLEQTLAESQRPQITRGDAKYAVEVGYQQTGRIVAISDNRIYQRFGGGENDVASYDLRDLDHTLTAREVDLAGEQGHNCVFTAKGNGRIQMVDLERQQDLSLAKRQARTQDRSLKIGSPQSMEL